MIRIKNQIIYLALDPKNLFHKLSINEWNKIITDYENDKNAVIEEYNKDMDGWFFATTTLSNILKNHSIMDLRFNIGYRTEYHKTDFNLSKPKNKIIL